MTGTTGLIAIVALFAVVTTAEGLTFTLDPNVRELFVAEGRFQEVDCYTDTPPAQANIVWKGPKDSHFTERPMTDKLADGSFIYHKILILNSFRYQDSGPYTCTLNYTDPSRVDEQQTINLISVIETLTEGEYFYKNKSAILACTIQFQGSASLQASFFGWFKGDVPVSELKDPERFKSESNGTLFISDPTREDAGLYTALYNVSGGERKVYNCSVEYKASPLVLNMPHSQNVYEEEDLELKCDVKGYPKATVTWLREGDVVTRDPKDPDRITMSENHGYKNARLMVKHVTSSDAGTYICRATNMDNETDEKSIVVRVRDPMEWLWPLIGIIAEVIVLFVIIFICERIKNKQRAKESALPVPVEPSSGRGGKKNQ